MPRIEPGTNYIVDIPLFDGAIRLTGKTVVLSIEKVSTGTYWDGAAFTTYNELAATELTGNNAAIGVYRYTFSTPDDDEETYRIVSNYVEPGFELNFYEEVITDLAVLDSATETQIDNIETTVTAISGNIWQTAEKANIRDALGVTGSKTTASGGQLQDIQGVGFLTGTHSLVALRNYLTSTIVPLLPDESTSSSALTGTFIESVTEAIRRYTDEPSVNTKYNDADILVKMSDAWAEVWLDLIFNAEWPMLVRYNLSYADGEYQALLPVNVGQLIQVARLSDNGTRSIEWEIDTRSIFNPRGWGVRINGNVLELGTNWNGSAETLELTYVPSGEIAPVDGKYESEESFSSTSITLPATVINGDLDTRPNAYAGYMLRLRPPVGTTPVDGDATTIRQEHVISGYNAITRVCTLATALDPAIALSSGEELVVEVVPMLHDMLASIVALRTAMNILASEGNKDRNDMLTMEYRRKLRSLKLQLNAIAGRRAKQFEGDTRDNIRSSYWHPFRNTGP